MSVVRYFTPEPKLAKLLSAPGGKYIINAIDDANAELGQVSDQVRAEIDLALAQVYAQADGVPAPEALPALYRAVRDVAGLAGICNLADLGSAALSFCALLDHAQEGGRLTVEHMAIYVNVLRVLRQAESFSAEDRAAVLANLEVMVAKLSGKSPSA